MAIKLDDRAKTALILAGIAVAAYLGYRWWKNRSSSEASSGLGANLNSVAPALVGGSTGPDSGLDYTAPTINVSDSAPVTSGGQASGGVTTPPAGGGPRSAPTGFSVTPHPGLVNIGWTLMNGVSNYEVKIVGAGGKGTGTSAYDKTIAGNHASVPLAPGRYLVTVRAPGGLWTTAKIVTVPKK